MTREHAHHPRPSLPTPGVIPFDRRREPRRPESGEGVAAWTPPGHTLRARLAPIRLLDLSPVGLGLRAPEPIAPGTPVTIQARRPYARTWSGRVVRCEPGPCDYRIGVALKARRAA